MEYIYNDNNKFIEAYYRNSLDEEQKKQFEEKIITDPSFANEVAFYISAMAVIKAVEREQTVERFKELYNQKPPAAKVIKFKKWYAYAVSAAAAVIIIAAGYFLFFQTTPRQLADEYVKEHLMELSIEMGQSPRTAEVIVDEHGTHLIKLPGLADSLQKGIIFYNNQQFDSAIQIFKSIYVHHPDNTEAKMDIGLAYLAMNNYAAALHEFDELATMDGLYASRSLFFKAIILMKRNNEGDNENAKQLLDKVVQQKLYGYAEAEKWKRKF